MKKSLLLFSAVLIAGFTNGQETSRSIIFTGANGQAAGTSMEGQPVAAPHISGHKTTVGGPGGNRWYDYVDDILANETAAPCVPVVGLSNTGLDIWQDSSSIFGYTGGTTYQGNDFTTIGLNLDPFITGLATMTAGALNGWNDPAAFPGVIAITTADNYSIDSVAVSGWYNRSYATPHKIGVVDTLILTFIQGNGTTGANNAPGGVSGGTGYCTTTLNYTTLQFDSLNNRAGNAGGAAVTTVYKFLMTSTDTNNSDANRGTQCPRPGHVPADPPINFAVTAGNMPGMSVSFVSGDGHFSPGGLYPAFPAHDTVRYSNGTAITGYKYGCWDANIVFSATASGGTTANFPPYNYPADHTSGYFKKIGAPSWGGLYLPNWAWSDALTGGGSALQYPAINFHVVCPACVLTGSGTLGVKNVLNLDAVTVTPNPANDNLTISFSNGQNATVSVSLTNMLGQVVATQKTTNGTSVFNTSALSAGVYIYTLEANGERSTGRVVVAH
jgi:hypothetical protein